MPYTSEQNNNEAMIRHQAMMIVLLREIQGGNRSSKLSFHSLHAGSAVGGIEHFSNTGELLACLFACLLVCKTDRDVPVGQMLVIFYKLSSCTRQNYVKISAY